MAQSDIEAILPEITPYPVPASIDLLYSIAYEQFLIDAPACAGMPSEDLAISYYIASLLSSGGGATGVKSEKIDDYTIQYGDGGQSLAYHQKYYAVIRNCNARQMAISAASGVCRGDTLRELNLDAATVVSPDDCNERLD